jgi:hypothetical protein
MSLLEKLDPESLTPAKLWAAMDEDSRRLAVETIYGSDFEDPSARTEVDAAIAMKLRFRPAAVRKLPQSKRIQYALRSLRPDDPLASTLLIALHLGRRREILEAFLDRLEIDHEEGVIQDESLAAPDGERLVGATAHLDGLFPREQVDLYLAALVAMEPDIWSGLIPLIKERSA